MKRYPEHQGPNPMDSEWGVRFNPLEGAPPDLHTTILRRYPFTNGDVVRFDKTGMTGEVLHVSSYGNVCVEVMRKKRFGRRNFVVEHWESDRCRLFNQLPCFPCGFPIGFDNHQEDGNECHGACCRNCAGLDESETDDEEPF